MAVDYKKIGLVNTKDMFARAIKGGWAVPAFNFNNLENKLLEEAHKIGLGAQFGGKYLAHDIRVIRLPRHGASCPIGMGVSCSADRTHFTLPFLVPLIGFVIVLAYAAREYKLAKK